MDIEKLPPHIIAEIRTGNKIEAIKLLREATGLGLKEAKDAIEAYHRSAPAQHVTTKDTPSPPPGEFPAEVIDALRQGQPAEAIKLLRDQTGLGLKEAKDAVDTYQAVHSTMIDADPSAEVSRTSERLWWVGLTLAAGALVYYVARNGL